MCDRGNFAPGGDLSPYLNYFPNLPGNRRYYNFSIGEADFFALDSDTNEPDGVTVNSAQAQWYALLLLLLCTLLFGAQ